MIRINLQNPKYETNWDVVHSYLIAKIEERYKSYPEDFIMSKEESNLRLLDYDEEIPTLEVEKVSFTSSVDTNTNSSSDSNPSAPSIKE